MEVQWILVCPGLITLFVLISFLCGQWPIFQGTPIEKVNYFLTFGAYDYLLRFVEYVCGRKGTNFVLGIEEWCCDRPNPILQVLYLAIISTTYYFIAKSSFSYIPGHYLSEVHIYASFLAVAIGVILFLLTSFSDPGIVKAENVQEYISAYPYDNIIFSQKECPTCKIPKPARSKHCSICGCCVARFDHHCGWMNNCIGEKNNRYFLGFLFWHFLLCLYGSVALGLILAGRFKELRVIYILTAYYGIENSFRSLAPHVVQWLLSAYNTQMLLMVFLAIVSLLLAGFFGYHANLCITNTTTNETFKWQDYVNLQRKVNEARASASALRASISGMTVEPNPPQSKWKAFFRRSPLEDAGLVVKTNKDDKGLLTISVRSFFHSLQDRHFSISRQSLANIALVICSFT